MIIEDYTHTVFTDMEGVGCATYVTYFRMDHETYEDISILGQKDLESPEVFEEVMNRCWVKTVCNYQILFGDFADWAESSLYQACIDFHNSPHHRRAFSQILMERYEARMELANQLSLF